MVVFHSCVLYFFFNDTATTEIYTLSLHDALPITATDCATASTRRRNRRACSASPWSATHTPRRFRLTKRKPSGLSWSDAFKDARRLRAAAWRSSISASPATEPRRSYSRCERRFG